MKTATRRFLAPILFALLLLATSVASAHSGHALPQRSNAESQVMWQISSATQRLNYARVTMFYAPELRDQAEQLAKKVPLWWAQIEDQLGRDVDDDVMIHFVTHPREIAAATGMPEWVGGVANGRRGEIAISLHGPDGRRANLESLLRHELAHVVMHRVLDGRRVPRWLNEGTADSVGAEIDLERAQTLSQAVFGGGVPTLSQLEADFRGESEKVTVAYAASRDFVRYLRYVDPDSSSFHYLLGQLRRGHDFEAAFHHAYGKSLSQLDAEWRAGLSARLLGHSLIQDSLPLMVVIPLLGAAWIRRRRLLAKSWARIEAQEAAAALRWAPVKRPQLI